ncbi:MAG TPA: class I SAM-dependent methyltransferase [Methylocella sp.]|nr:class I SAM-dependent methyltransferase [Methylocella sp.]
MAALSELEIVSRYRDNYGLSDAVGIKHVEQHRELEADLTRKLLSASPENRWRVFDDCYTTLYQSLPWLNGAGEDAHPRKERAWRGLLKKPSAIFEVGSGDGRLLRYLATLGHHCVATEITAERGARHVQDVAGLEWRITDGVNLAKFEPVETYDVVVSSQVIEHFHPDDVQRHFENARLILKQGGEYIFDTPHVGAGPHDLSKVFGLDRPAFMHLKEYDFRELGRIAKAAGFKKVQAILFYQSGRFTLGPFRSHLLYLYYCFVDSLLSAFKLTPRRERAVRRVLRLALVPSNIWLVAKK